MELFPKEKLTGLYQKKLAEDEGFRRAMESFFSDEWNEIYSALWQNNAFVNEVAILKENGINVELTFFEWQAIIQSNNSDRAIIQYKIKEYIILLLSYYFNINHKFYSNKQI